MQNRHPSKKHRQTRCRQSSLEGQKAGIAHNLAHIVEALRPLAVPITDVKLDPKNARTHNQQNIRAIVASLRQFGQRKPIVVNRKDHQIEAGNGTRQAAEQLGWTHVAVVFVEDDPTTATGYAIADNRTAELADWDDDLLLTSMNDIKEHSPDLFEDLLLAEMFDDDEQTINPPDAQIDLAGKLCEKWKVEPGQLWVIGGSAGEHRVLCGDATKRENVAKAMAGHEANVAFTDPPYGVAYQNDMDAREAVARHRRRDGAVIANDKKTPRQLESFLTATFRILPLSPGGVFYICAPAGDRYLPFLRALQRSNLQMRQGLCWVKQQMVFGRQDYHYQHEMIVYGWKSGAAHYFVNDRTQTSVWEVDRPQTSAEHPTMKPVGLPSKAIANSSRPGEVIFDPFLGSGSTMMAAEQLGRICYGMEIEPKYVAVILERMANMGLKPELGK